MIDLRPLITYYLSYYLPITYLPQAYYYYLYYLPTYHYYYCITLHLLPLLHYLSYPTLFRKPYLALPYSKAISLENCQISNILDTCIPKISKITYLDKLTLSEIFTNTMSSISQAIKNALHRGMLLSFFSFFPFLEKLNNQQIMILHTSCSFLWKFNISNFK